MKIYTNSYIHSEEINPENFIQVFETYADKLEEMAKDYRNLTKIVKTKNIKIIDAHGFAHGGHFSVDEIDTGRLKKEGVVIDYAEQPSEDNAVFYVDTELDSVLEDAIEQLEEFDPDFEEMTDSIMDKIFNEEDRSLTEEEEALIHDIIDEDNFDIEQIDIDFDEIFPERSSHFNLSEKIGNFSDDNFSPGNMIIEVKKIDEDRFTFNLTMADLGDSPTKINYMRDKSIFEYECNDCDATHFESLDSIYRSLKTANAILSNLIEMTKDFRELSAALEFIDSDLRLLQWLLRLDYALEDNPDEDPEDLDLEELGELEEDEEE
jgi:hypothetical protein